MDVGTSAKIAKGLVSFKTCQKDTIDSDIGRSKLSQTRFQSVIRQRDLNSAMAQL